MKQIDFMSKQDLAGIVERASSIEERLSGDFVPVEGADAALVDERLEAWSQALGRGRTGWSGGWPGTAWTRRRSAPLSAPCVCARARAYRNGRGCSRRPSAWPRPSEGGDDEAWPAEMGFLDAEDALPFEEILAPFVLVARERLAGARRPSENLLSAAARAALERSLLRSLSSRSASYFSPSSRPCAPGTVVLGSVVRFGTRPRGPLPVPAVRPPIG